MFTYLNHIPPTEYEEINRRRAARQFQLPGSSVLCMNRGVETRRIEASAVQASNAFPPKGREVYKAYISARPYPEFHIHTDTKLTRVRDTDLRAVQKYMQAQPPAEKIKSENRGATFHQETRLRGEARVP
jgi:hypothetical protein